MNGQSGKYVNNELESSLRNWFSGFKRVVIVGIGNSLRKDDFIGIEVVRSLRNKVPSAVNLIECETVPESFIVPIIELNPSHILIIDAASLDLEPGDARLVDYKELKEQQVVSTHALPLRIFCQYLLQMTGAGIALLLIQPKDTSFGENLTQELDETAMLLTELLSGILGE